MSAAPLVTVVTLAGSAASGAAGSAAGLPSGPLWGIFGSIVCAFIGGGFLLYTSRDRSMPAKVEALTKTVTDSTSALSAKVSGLEAQVRANARNAEQRDRELSDRLGSIEEYLRAPRRDH
jgi:hypothetical protein